MGKLNSFRYKGLTFRNTNNNIFQTDKFGDKLIYELKGNNYHLIKDERLSPVISLAEVSRNPNSYHNDDNNWK